MSTPSAPGFSGSSAPAAPAAPSGGAAPSTPNLRSVPGTGGGIPGAGQSREATGHQPAGGAQQLPDSPEFQSFVRSFQQRESQLKTELEQLRGKTSESDAVLTRLRDALNPGKKETVDPRVQRRQHAESRLDYMLQAALESERAGRPMPLTANLAADLYEYQIEQTEKEARLMTELTEMKQKLDQATNPNTMIDVQAFTTMDSQLQQAIGVVFGQGEEYAPQRQAQFRAVSQQIVSEIKDLQKAEPQTWDEIRRSPQKLQRMVNYFVEQNLPPRARQILQQEQIMREPQSIDNMLQAFREAHEAYRDDPRQLQRVVPEIRAQILAEMMNERRGKRGRANISSMYR